MKMESSQPQERVKTVKDVVEFLHILRGDPYNPEDSYPGSVEALESANKYDFGPAAALLESIITRQKAGSLPETISESLKEFFKRVPNEEFIALRHTID